jgi:hypothetical protein
MPPCLPADMHLGRDKTADPVKIIFDTDLEPDYDDVGPLAFLHAMADSGEMSVFIDDRIMHLSGSKTK